MLFRTASHHEGTFVVRRQHRLWGRRTRRHACERSHQSGNDADVVGESRDEEATGLEVLNCVAKRTGRALLAFDPRVVLTLTWRFG